MSRVVVLGGQARSLVNFRGLLIQSIALRGHDVTAVADLAPPEVKEALRGLGAAFRSYPIQRNKLNPIADARAYLSLRRLLRELRPDVVLAYMIKPVVWGGLILRPFGTTRFYALITGLGFAFHGASPRRRMLTGLATRLYRLSLARATAVFFQNPDNMQVFVDRGIVAREKCHLVNGSGVDLRRFQHRPAPTGGAVFLMIARLLGEKGVREYAAAAEVVKERYPLTEFRLLGPADTSPDRISVDEVRGWEARGIISYLGVVEDVVPHIEACTVFVLPSHHEGMPRTVLEAMAVGRPIITTDVPGCRETVIPNKNGMLVPCGDASALARAMVWCVEHEQRLSEMGHASRRLAEENFDVRAVNRDMMAVMELL